MFLYFSIVFAGQLSRKSWEMEPVYVTIYKLTAFVSCSIAKLST